MKERPILFSGPMVRALLDGSKTQTRRIAKPQPPMGTRDVFTFHHPSPRTHYWAFDGDSLLDWAYPCPQGDLGDRLYVREAWQHSNHPLGPYEPDCDVFYRADYLDDPLGADLERSADGIRRQWRPSIHMPRAASRITLEVTGVRVERLQDITESDARSEGAIHGPLLPMGWSKVECVGDDAAMRSRFAVLWDNLAVPGSDWDANPWVWVVEFKRAA
jgi:hypothetical protein